MTVWHYVDYISAGVIAALFFYVFAHQRGYKEGDRNGFKDGFRAGEAEACRKFAETVEIGVGAAMAINSRSLRSVKREGNT
jgi:flagellar biosynthesis/type III secretory pathway protein FliH